MDLTGPVVKVPKLTAGATAAEQSAQNTSITTSNFTDEYLSTTAVTIAGATAVSQQLIDLSPLAIDQIVFTDLFAALAQEVEYALWYDTNFGIDNLVQQTYALGSSNAEDFYSGVSKAVNFIHTTRYMAPDAIFAHPSVVNHLKSRFDTVGRPLVAPTDTAYNPVAVAPDAAPADGPALRLLGLPVYADANISTSGVRGAICPVVRQDFVDRNSDVRVVIVPFATPIDPYHPPIGWWEDLGLGADEFVDATE